MVEAESYLDISHHQMKLLVLGVEFYFKFENMLPLLCGTIIYDHICIPQILWFEKQSLELSTKLLIKTMLKDKFYEVA